jgi:thiol-disulfide isomerase/thioredoxin
MLKKILPAALLVLSLNAFAEYHFKLKGIVYKELNDKVLHLKIEDGYSSKKHESEYSVVIKNGAFVFEGTIPNVTEYATLSIYGKGINYFHYLMIDSGMTTINILPVSAKSVTYKNKLSNASVDNSPSNELSEKINSLKNYHYTHFSTPSPNNPVILRLSKERIIELDRAILEKIQQYPASFAALIELYMIANKLSLPSDELLHCFSVLHAGIREGDLGLRFNQYMKYRKSVEMGQAVSEFESITSGDTLFKNKYLAGSPYLLAFGTTWCKSCKEDYPLLKKLHQSYKQSGFEIVGINMDDKKQTWLAQVAKYSLPWIHTTQIKKPEYTELGEVFNVVYFPTYILVGKNGEIKYHSIQLKDYELKQLEKYIVDEINLK